MPVNRLALIRYKTIDNCLRNRFRDWTLQDLVEACSDALYEFEGKEEGVSVRTVQLDIQNMRSEKLGYNAPIIVVDRKYYTYEDPDYSITNMPLSPDDIETLVHITHTLKQFEGFKEFSNMEVILKGIENKVFAINNKNTRTIIDFDKNNQLKGIEYLNEIYNAIKDKIALKINYMPFHYSSPLYIKFSPYLLKEFNNRWFVFGRRMHKNITIPLALDRIVRLKPDSRIPFEEDPDFNYMEYFKDIIGVTLDRNKPVEKIIFEVRKDNAPYVETKPFHHSQQILGKTDFGSIFSIDVIPNYEMERLMLGFGNYIIIKEPIWLRERFINKLNNSLKLYSREDNEN